MKWYTNFGHEGVNFQTHMGYNLNSKLSYLVMIDS